MVLNEARVEEVAILLEELAVALRLLLIDIRSRAGEAPNAQRQAQQDQAPPPHQPFDGVVRVGSRVRVVGGALNSFRGRTGVVLSQRGQLYWNLQLDIRGRETERPLIYKKGSSLQVVQ